MNKPLQRGAHFLSGIQKKKVAQGALPAASKSALPIPGMIYSGRTCMNYSGRIMIYSVRIVIYAGRIMVYSGRIVIYSGRIMIYPAGAKSPGTNKDRKALAELSMPDISVT